MHSKLTLRLNDAAIARGKAYAHRTGKSVSQLVEDFFALLGEPAAVESLPPITRELHGLLTGATIDEEAYRTHLAEKHA